MTGKPDCRRRSLHLRSYDCAQAGAYFVTICTQARACLSGEIVDGAMQLNDAGRIVADDWEALPGRFVGIDVDAFIVMPMASCGSTPQGRHPWRPTIHTRTTRAR